MIVRKTDHLIEIFAPAKVNLFLELLARRTDGFHEVETVMSSISLFDSVGMTPRGDGKIALTVDSSDDTVPTGGGNLVSVALQRLRMACGESRGLNVALKKRIPNQSGLGGGSSDAAAALIGANAIWNLNWSVGRLAPIAASIGSDVAFFLTGGTAMCTGRGEIVNNLSAPAGLALVIAMPGQGLSTAEVYKHCQVPDSPRSSRSLVEAITAGNSASIGKQLWNRLEVFAVALGESIVRLKSEFSKTACLGHQLSGSGASYFGIFANHRAAKIAAGQLSNRLPDVTIFHGQTLCRPGYRPVPLAGWVKRSVL